MALRRLAEDSAVSDPIFKEKRYRIQPSDIDSALSDLSLLKDEYLKLKAELLKLGERQTVKKYLDTVEKLKKIEEKFNQLGYNLILQKINEVSDDIGGNLEAVNEALSKEIVRSIELRSERIDVVVKKARASVQAGLSEKQLNELLGFLTEFLNLEEDKVEAIARKIEEIKAEDVAISGQIEITVQKINDIGRKVEEIERSVPIEVYKKILGRRQVPRGEDLEWYYYSYLIEGRIAVIDKIKDRISEFLDSVKEFGKDVVAKVAGFLRSVQAFFEDLINTVEFIVERARNVADDVEELKEIVKINDGAERKLDRIISSEA